MIHSKPLLEMSTEEFAEAFRGAGKQFSGGMLERARRGQDQQVLIAMVMLKRPGASDVIVFTDCEYGDRAAVGMCESVMQDMVEEEELLPGESLYVTLMVARQLETVNKAIA